MAVDIWELQKLPDWARELYLTGSDKLMAERLDGHGQLSVTHTLPNLQQSHQGRSSRSNNDIHVAAFGLPSIFFKGITDV